MVAASGLGSEEYEQPPIAYSETDPTDRVAQLAAQIERGQVALEWDDRWGWLPSLLEHLGAPRKSQTLVFSKTSQQIRRISSWRPRALYFNDDVYVGWVQRGDFVEIAAVDREQGAIFYTLDQHNQQQPIITRDNGKCLSCHASARTKRVPGFLVRSLYTKASGQPEYRLGSVTVDHSTPLTDRFGGWYVTGQHGAMRHRGNAMVLPDDESEDPINREASANLVELPKRVTPSDYLEPSSDLVALMLLEHQTQMHNLVTRASYAARRAVHQQKEFDRHFKRDSDGLRESTVRRIETAADDLLEYVFFCDEFPLAAPIKGSSDFAEEFAAAGVRDPLGRSLRDLDLQTRLLRYPCSYLVYSESFLALPEPTLDYLRLRMTEILLGEDTSEEFAHLSAEDRQSILEILQATHPLFQAE